MKIQYIGNSEMMGLWVCPDPSNISLFELSKFSGLTNLKQITNHINYDEYEVQYVELNHERLWYDIKEIQFATPDQIQTWLETHNELNVGWDGIGIVGDLDIDPNHKPFKFRTGTSVKFLNHLAWGVGNVHGYDDIGHMVDVWFESEQTTHSCPSRHLILTSDWETQQSNLDDVAVDVGSPYASKPEDIYVVGDFGGVTNYDMVNPPHYKNKPIETIEKMRRIWGDDMASIYCDMTAFKYRDRIGDKPHQPVEQEIGKIKWYETKSKELRSN